MAELIDITRALDALGINSEMASDVSGSVTAAFASTVARTETALETRLTWGQGSDLFHLDADYFSGVQADGMFRLLLSAGFVRDDAPVLVEVMDGWKSGPVSDVDSADWILKNDSGLVYVPDSYRGKYIRVSYQSGFKDASEIDAAAPWVREAMLCYLPMVVNALRTNGTTEGASNESFRLRGELAEGVIGLYSRKPGFALRPMIPGWVPIV